MNRTLCVFSLGFAALLTLVGNAQADMTLVLLTPGVT